MFPSPVAIHQEGCTFCCLIHSGEELGSYLIWALTIRSLSPLIR
jgi:hypothetical protein